MTAIPIRVRAPFSPKFVQLGDRAYKVVDRDTDVEVCLVNYRSANDDAPARWVSSVKINGEMVTREGMSRAEAIEALIQGEKLDPVSGDTVAITPVPGPGESVDTEPGLQPWKAMFIGRTTDGRAIVSEAGGDADRFRVVPYNIVSIAGAAA